MKKKILIVIWYIIVLILGAIFIIGAFTILPMWLFSLMGGGM